jgi:Cdc6-like AAA superfamily ATPase
VDELQRHKTTLNLALTADGMSALLHALSRQSEIREDVREIKTELRKRRDLADMLITTQKQREIIHYFGNINPQITQDSNLRLQQPGTGLWFTDGEEFQSWLKKDGSRLWIYGIPGAGKTILMSLIIQNVKRQMDEDDAVSYFFCDYKNVATHDPSNILKSLAKQLALQGKGAFSILEKFYDRFHSEGSLPTVPSPEELRDLVVAICQSFSHTFIIVDGLDECTGDRSYVVRLLSSCNTVEITNVRILLASRDELDIRKCLSSYVGVSIAAQSSDLKLYVAAEIQNRTESGTLTIRQSSLKSHIMEVLVEKAAGM